MRKMLLCCFLMMVGWGTIHAVQPRPAAKKVTTAPVKSDGTPDMRYKVNKERKKQQGPLKKDGTPDKRYKANRDQKNA